MNGVNNLIINKVDILDKVGVWNVYYRGQVLDLKNKEAFENWICDRSTPYNVKVFFSYNPYNIEWNEKCKKQENDLKNVDRFLG